MATTPYHLQKPRARHTIYSTDRSVKIFLDDKLQLLFTPSSSPYPYALDSVSVLALANLLHDEYHAIATEAKKFNGNEKPGRKRYEYIYGKINIRPYGVATLRR